MMRHFFLFLFTNAFLNINVSAETIKLPAYPNELGPKTFDQSTIEQFKKGYKDIVIHGFNGNEQFQSSRLQRSYFMKKPKNFFGKFLIANYTTTAKIFKLYFFIDYQQQKFKLFDKSSIVHTVSVNKNSEIILPLFIENITNGAHDILILAINNQYEELNQSNILSHRANIYVNKGGFKKVKFNELTNNLKNNNSTEIIINSSHNRLNQKPQTVFNKTKDHKYFIHVNNHYNIKMNYSLIVLLDSIQIPIKSSSENTFYFQLNKFTKNIISIPLDSVKDKKELLAIIIDNPYAVLEPERSIFSTIKSRVRISNKVQKSRIKL